MPENLKELTGAKQDIYYVLMSRTIKRRSSLSKIKILFILAMLTFVAPLFMFLPNVSALRYKNPTRTRFMEIYLDRMEDTGENPTLQHIWRPMEQISPYLAQAVLLAEDDTFYKHSGFDWDSFRQAMKKNWKDKAFTRGASTITQQLVKNLYLTPSKNPWRKLREWIITYQTEQTLTKKRILDLYLNIAEWGPGIYGAEAASRHYFGKSSSALTPHQAAFLASILPNPKFYSARPNGKVMTRRMGYLFGVLNRKNGSRPSGQKEKPSANHLKNEKPSFAHEENPKPEEEDTAPVDESPSETTPTPFLDD